MLGLLPAPLASSTLRTPCTKSYDNSKGLLALSNVPWGTRVSPIENHTVLQGHSSGTYGRTGMNWQRSTLDMNQSWVPAPAPLAHDLAPPLQCRKDHGVSLTGLMWRRTWFGYAEHLGQRLPLCKLLVAWFWPAGSDPPHSDLENLSGKTEAGFSTFTG